MLKKTITYKDLDGNEVVEDFYFALNKAEIAEMELTQKGGLSEHLKTIIASEDGGEIMAMFKKIVGMSIGRRSEDGKRFVKSAEISEHFFQTDAYSELFMELVTNADAAAAFIRGIVPSDVEVKIPKDADILQLPGSNPKWLEEKRLPTQAEMDAMPADELRLAMQYASGKKAFGE